MKEPSKEERQKAKCLLVPMLCEGTHTDLGFNAVSIPTQSMGTRKGFAWLVSIVGWVSFFSVAKKRNPLMFWNIGLAYFALLNKLTKPTTWILL